MKELHLQFELPLWYSFIPSIVVLAITAFFFISYIKNFASVYSHKTSMYWNTLYKPFHNVHFFN